MVSSYDRGEDGTGFLDEVFACQPFDLWRGGQINAGLGSFGRTDRAELGKADEPSGKSRVVQAKTSSNKTGMRRIGCDPGFVQPAGELVGEKRVGQFGLRYRFPGPNRASPLALQVVEGDPGVGVRRRRYV